jgi:hypothetical protein
MTDDLPRRSYEVLAALVVSLRQELAEIRAELERARGCGSRSLSPGEP